MAVPLAHLRNLPFAQWPERASATPILRSADGATHWPEFLLQLKALSAGLSEISEQRIVVFAADAGQFLALILACWQVGKTPLIAPNTLPDSRTSLQQHSEVWVGDAVEYPQCLSYETLLSNGGSATLAAEQATQVADSEIALCLFTSGSTGQAMLVEKSFAQLQAELDMLELTLGKHAQGLLFVSSVSHHHMYGLPFHILWPFVQQRCIFTTQLEFLEALPELLERHRIALICSPVHLSRIPTSVDWSNCHGSIGLLLSAGAPLPEEAARDARRMLGLDVTEIYGSTETGAVASRKGLGQKWQFLPGMHGQCGPDGELQLKSASLGTDAWVATQDKVELSAAGEFELLGRLDKIVKVAGQRVSLSAMETCLNEHPWVDNAKVLPHPIHRNRLLAIVQLSPAGRSAVIDQNVLATQRTLRDGLQGGFPQSVLPRYWRFVARMPVNSQGKTTAQQLHALVAEDTETTQAVELTRAFHPEQNTIHQRFYAPLELSYFDGHFTARPILAGVVQLQWAEALARDAFSISAAVTGLEAVKFSRVILPEEHIDLYIRFATETNTAHFKFVRGDELCAQGRIVFRGQ